MRSIFSFVLLIHGLIHLMGFVKAFNLAQINQLNQGISRPFGMLWFISTLLFIMATTLYMLKNQSWYSVAIIAVLLSQLLIFFYWKDAKFGTIANFIILWVSITTHGSNQFYKMVQKETINLIQKERINETEPISKEHTSSLPPIVQQWMHYSGAVGKKQIKSVRLQQVGEMKSKPTGTWMHFTAEQVFNINDPSFIWTTKADINRLFYLLGRDKLVNGQGEMFIKLLGVFRVINEKNNKKIDQGAMVRYLSEIIWFPSAALNTYVKWEAIDATSAKAIFKLRGKEVSGIFKFKANGQFKSFEAQRYYGGNEHARLEKWLIQALDHKDFNGYMIPHKCAVTWQLNDGDFNWLNLEVVDLELDIHFDV